MHRIKELMRLAWRVSTLGAGPVARVRILLLGLSLPVKKRVPGLRRRHATLYLRRFGCDFEFVIVDRADFVILWEVFIKEVYETSFVPEPRVVVDLGSNVGASVVFFALRYPRCRIVAVEPSPAVHARLIRNVGWLSSVRTVRSAVVRRDGAVSFFVSDEGLSSSLSPAAVERARVPYRRVEVEGRTLVTLLRELEIERVDLLKLDIEGAEEDVLKSADALARVEALVGELHFDLVESSREDLLACLGDFTVTAQPDPMPDIPGADRWRLVAVRTRTAD
jgi:FkbM family methyltransferase